MARPDAFGDLLGGFDAGMANASQQMAPPEQADNVTQDLDKFGTFRCCQMAPHNVWCPRCDALVNLLKVYYDLDWPSFKIICSTHLLGCYCHPD